VLLEGFRHHTTEELRRMLLNVYRKLLCVVRSAYTQFTRWPLGFTTPLEARQHYENQCLKLAAA
jgi:hypothetical protein